MRERVVGTNAITLSKTCDYIQFGSFKFRLRAKTGSTPPICWHPLLVWTHAASVHLRFNLSTGGIMAGLQWKLCHS